LLEIKLPVPGLVSIGHRISGVLMILAIPFVAYLFALSLENPAGFAQAKAFLSHGLVKLGLVVLFWGLAHHLLMGIRYLLIDMDHGVDLASARATAWGAGIGGLVITLLFLGVLL
jgi:succinate dehydrogenase / fumarate reductase cytochrome b subunit